MIIQNLKFQVKSLKILFSQSFITSERKVLLVFKIELYLQE